MFWDFAITNRYGSLHLEGPIHHGVHAPRHRRLLLRIPVLVHDGLVEVAVAYVADHAGEEAELGGVFF